MREVVVTQEMLEAGERAYEAILRDRKPGSTIRETRAAAMTAAYRAMRFHEPGHFV